MNINLSFICSNLMAQGFQAEICKIPCNGVEETSIVIYTDNGNLVIPEGLLKTNCTNDEEALDVIHDIISSYKQDAPDLKILTEAPAETLLPFLSIGVCRNDWNGEQLQNAFVRRIDDTDLSFYLSVSIPGKDKTFISSLPKWSSLAETFPEEELFSIAMKNTGKTFLLKDLDEFMEELFDVAVEQLQKPKAVVLTKNNLQRGASCGLLPENLEYARNYLGAEEITVIPSSVHEIICVAGLDTAGIGWLTDCIIDTNAHYVHDADILSDHPYIWNGKTLRNA